MILRCVSLMLTLTLISPPESDSCKKRYCSTGYWNWDGRCAVDELIDAVNQTQSSLLAASSEVLPVALDAQPCCPSVKASLLFCLFLFMFCPKKIQNFSATYWILNIYSLGYHRPTLVLNFSCGRGSSRCNRRLCNFFVQFVIGLADTVSALLLFLVCWQTRQL